MKVRTRLVASFAYVLLVVIVALTVPLAIVLRDRARSELEALALTNAQTVAAVLNQDRLDDDRPIGDGWSATRSGTRPTSAGGSSSSTPTGPSSSTPRVRMWETTSRRPAGRRSRRRSTPRRSPTCAGATRRGATSRSGRHRSSTRESSWARSGSPGACRPSKRTSAAPPPRSPRWRSGGLVAGLVLAVALARSIARPMTRLATTARSFGEGELSSRAGPIEGGRGGEGARRTPSTRWRSGPSARFARNGSSSRTPPTSSARHSRGSSCGSRARSPSTTDPRIRDELRAADQEVDRLAQIIERLLTMATPDRGGERAHGPTWAMPSIGRRAVERASGAGVVDALGAGPAGRLGGGRPRRRRSGPRRPDRQRADVRARSDRGACTEQGDRVGVSVADHGPGISADEVSRVTERFYRGRGAPAGRLRARARDRAGARRAVGRGIVGGR